jgi:hypothetical protein
VADGTVRGAFELTSEQAIRSLTEIRDRGREADAALESLGRRMDTLGIKTVRPKIDLTGIDAANAKLTELEARLDRIGSRSATARVGINSSGGGMLGSGFGGGGMLGGGGSSPSVGRTFSSPGGLPGAVPWWLAAAPLAPQLLGGAGALIGSAGAGLGGIGTVGLGALGPLAAGGAMTLAVTKPAITALEGVTKAQTAYNNAVAEFGRRSTQAASAARNLNLAVTQNPMAVGAARQVAATRSAFQTATTPARGNVFRGISGVAYNARQAMPTIGLGATAATGASASAATAFSGFLAQPGEQAMMLQLTGAFAQNLPIAERSLENIATTFLHLSVDAVPFFHEANVWVQNWSTGLASSSANSTKVTSDMRVLVTSAKDWGGLGGAMVRDIKDLFAPSVGPGNSMVVSLTNTLDKWDVWLRDNPGKVRQFFSDAEQGVSRIATVLSNVAHDVWQIFQAIQPMLLRAEGIAGVASSLGGGSLLAGGSLLYGAYNGARGAFGGGGPSAGGLARSFITGGGGGLGIGLMAGGGAMGGGASVGTAAARSGTGYLMPASGMGSEGLMLAAGGGMLMRASTADRLGIGAARGAVAFNQAYGGIEGARYAMPESAAGLVPLSERGGIAGLAGRTGAAARGAIGGAARIILPLAAIQGLVTGLGTGGGVPHAIGAGISSAASTLTLGAVSPSSFQHILGAGFGATNAGGQVNQGQLRDLANAANSVRTPAQMNHVLGQVASVRIGAELDPKSAAALQAQLTRIATTAAGNAGASASNTWETSFTRGLDRGTAPQKAVSTMIGGMSAQISALGPRGATSFAKDTASWVSQLQAENPRLQAPLNRLMDGITQKINDMNDATGQTFSDLQHKVFFFNGQILTGAQTTWGKIHDAMVNPSLSAQEKLSGIWGNIQKQAINALSGMGFTQAQARTIVTQSASGKAGQQAMAATSVAQRQQTLAAAPAGLTVGPLGTIVPNPQHHARGGMINGTGLLDTVNLGGGVMAAPGEAYIANRHTMRALSSATMAKYGKTAEMMIRDEGRPHSAPMALGGGLPPTIQANGVAGHPELHPGISRAVAAVLGMFPGLKITSTTGGTHAGGSYHYLGEAADVAGDSGTMFRAASWIGSSGLARQLTEGIHNPNLSVKYGHNVPSSYWGAATWGQHLNHIHMAVAGALNAGALTGGAVGGGGAVGAMPSALNLTAPGVGIGGIPGAIANQASRMYAAGLSQKINSRLGAGAGAISGAGFSGGGAPSANQALGQRMMLAAGWGMSQWPSLLALWNQESGWNANAVNSSSGAYGIPQALGHGHPYNLGDAPSQIAWGLNYIRGRYGSPQAAEAHERSSNWYARGGRINWAGWNAKGGSFTTNGPTLFGAGEKGREKVTISHGGGDRAINITMNGVTLYGADERQLDEVARHVAGKILDALDGAGGGSDAQMAGVG